MHGEPHSWFGGCLTVSYHGFYPWLIVVNPYRVVNKAGFYINLRRLFLCAFAALRDIIFPTRERAAPAAHN